MRRLLVCVFVLAAVLGGVGIALAGPGPNGHNDYGLCKAYFAGSDTGREHKRKAPPFQALEDAAGVDSDDTENEADDKVAEYCAETTPGGR